MDDATLQAFIQATHSQLQQASASQAALTTQVAQLTAQLASLPTAPHRSALKAPKPARFAGERTPDSADVEVWVFAVSNFFNAAGATTDAERITHAVGLLEKTALQWWLGVVDQGGAQRPTTWLQFTTALIARFRPINAERAARVRLGTITQTGSVASYAAAFQKLLMRVKDLPDAQVLLFFVNGLQPAIQRELIRWPPADLATAISDAERIASVDSQIKRPGHSSHTSSYAAASSSTATPMELGMLDDDGAYNGDDDHLMALQRRPSPSAASAFNSPPGRTRPPMLSAAERARCVDHRLCFRCRKPGHAAHECRAFPTIRPSAGQNGGPPRA